MRILLTITLLTFATSSAPTALATLTTTAFDTHLPCVYVGPGGGRADVELDGGCGGNTGCPVEVTEGEPAACDGATLHDAPPSGVHDAAPSTCIYVLPSDDGPALLTLALDASCPAIVSCGEVLVLNPAPSRKESCPGDGGDAGDAS